MREWVGESEWPKDKLIQSAENLFDHLINGFSDRERFTSNDFIITESGFFSSFCELLARTHEEIGRAHNAKNELENRETAEKEQKS